MEPIPELQKQQSLRQQELLKLKAVGFFKGCGRPRCIHAGCPNYIGDKQLSELRSAPDQNISAVLELIEEGDLDVECAVPLTPVTKLPEAFHRLPRLFAFDFNEVLNMSSVDRLETFRQLRTEIAEQLATEETEYREKALLYFEEFNRRRVLSFVNLLDRRVPDFDVFELLLGFFMCFDVVFDYELFTGTFDIHKVFHSARFGNLLSDDMVEKARASPVFQGLVTKKRIAQFNEDLQNLLTLCYPLSEYLTATGRLRQFSLRLLCRNIEFLMHLNTMLPCAQRLPLKEFTNPTLSEDCSDKTATLGFIASHPNHPLQGFIQDDLAAEDSPDQINFMEYPFLFTVDRRVDVLNLESDLFQKKEIFGGANNNFLGMLMSGAIYLSLKLRRDHVLEDALTQLSKAHSQNNLRKKLKVAFVGEPGVDEGGVKKEFFGLLTERLFDPNFGMFVVKNDRFLWFNHTSLECNLNFELVGTLLGLALYNEVILNLRFPLAVYKKLIAAGSRRPIFSDQLRLDDLQEFDPDLHRTLHKLLAEDWTGKDTGLTFAVSYEVFGEVKEVELVENGSGVPVTQDNKEDFVRRYLDWYFDHSIKDQFKSFAVGFFRVFLKDSFTLFNAEDLQLAICGSTTLDFHGLKKTTNYENYTENSETIVHFWSILLNDFDDQQRREFLKFLTGSDRAPIRGLVDIRMIVTKTGDSNSLPSAHTCFNHLILPDYKDYEKLKAKLLKAIENSEGFGLF